MRSLGQSIHHINNSSYKLDTGGVAGLFGGDAAVDALTTVPLFAGRRWVGWYNYPGSHEVAMRFGRMANTQWWNILFPGTARTSGDAFGLAKSGPAYRGSFSGTILPSTKYLGHLTAEECASYRPKEVQLSPQPGKKAARKSGGATAVTIISLPPKQHERILESRAAGISPSDVKKKHGSITINPKSDNLLPLLAIVPSLVSILASVLCLLGDDPLCAALIIFGILNGGISSLVLGTVALKIRVPVPSTNSPPADGLMSPADGNRIVLKGEEADVNIITKGEFELDYSAGILSDDNHHMIGCISIFLFAQFLSQLLLLSFCTLFGQIVFLASFVASGAYHLYVTSHQREKIHRELLFRQLSSPLTEKWQLGTRAQMAVFACLCVGDGRRDSQKINYRAILNDIVGNETEVWECWRKKVLKELARFWKSESPSYVPIIQAGPGDRADEDDENDYWGLAEQDKMLLEDLIDDAWCVFNGYKSWRNTQSEIWRGQSGSTGEKALLHQGGSLA